MFEGRQYLLTIPLPRDISDEMNKLIYAIAEKSAEDPANITSKTQIRPEFHVTLGVFHPHMFETNKGLFKQFLKYLHDHKDQYQALKHMFRGQCVISGVGFYGGSKKNLIGCDVVWASVVSNEIPLIREKMQNLLGSAGIDKEHFIFTDPHITLITKKGDIHDMAKPPMLSLNEFLKNEQIVFGFNTVNFEKEMGKVVFIFGGSNVDGRPSMKYSKFAKQMKKSITKDPVYNWANLFGSSKYKSDAATIKKLVTAEGIAALFKNYPKDQALEIKLLISK